MTPNRGPVDWYLGDSQNNPGELAEIRYFCSQSGRIAIRQIVSRAKRQQFNSTWWSFTFNNSRNVRVRNSFLSRGSLEEGRGR